MSIVVQMVDSPHFDVRRLRKYRDPMPNKILTKQLNTCSNRLLSVADMLNVVLDFANANSGARLATGKHTPNTAMPEDCPCLLLQLQV